MQFRLLILAVAMLTGMNSNAQKAYFQQKTDYTISAILNPEKKAIHGHVSLAYFNASPDTLNFIWFHIWPNAYSGDNTALARQAENDKELKKAMKKAEKGFIDSLAFSSQGIALKTELQEEHPDILKVVLAKPLHPGQSVKIETPFYNKLPTYFSRSGFSDGQFIATQWYPKPAVYDRDGWHPMPYLDMGEYYANFGNFDVSITAPANMVIAASGTLHDANELTYYKKAGKANNDKNQKQGNQPALPGSGTKTLRYRADNVHDFAWFAMPGFLVQYDTCMLSSGKIIDVFSYYRPDARQQWVNTIDYLKAGVRFYSTNIGEYPHPHVSAVQGPRNVNSGGMEYPMITLITVPQKEAATQLESTIVHEVGHNWFQGILGTNERKYPWFDEGINSYYQFLYEAQQKKNSIFGARLPAELQKLPPNEFFSIIMQNMAQVPFTYAINTASDDFKSKDGYGVTAYIKGAVWMYILQSRIGLDAFNTGMQDFFETWKFRHPAPDDLKVSMEKAAGYALEDVFSLLDSDGRFAKNE